MHIYKCYSGIYTLAYYGKKPSKALFFWHVRFLKLDAFSNLRGAIAPISYDLRVMKLMEVYNMCICITQKKIFTSVVNIATFIALYVVPYKVWDIYKTPVLLWINHCISMEIKSQNQMQKFYWSYTHFIWT